VPQQREITQKGKTETGRTVTLPRKRKRGEKEKKNNFSATPHQSQRWKKEGKEKRVERCRKSPPSTVGGKRKGKGGTES